MFLNLNVKSVVSVSYDECKEKQFVFRYFIEKYKHLYDTNKKYIVVDAIHNFLVCECIEESVFRFNTYQDVLDYYQITPSEFDSMFTLMIYNNDDTKEELYNWFVDYSIDYDSSRQYIVIETHLGICIYEFNY